jgi:methionine-rich copper-binding protein CopC
MRPFDLFGLALLLLAVTASAQAHSAFVRSEPAAGAKLKKAPNEIKIWFSEPIKVALSTFEVRDPARKQINLSDLRADEKDHTLIRLSLTDHLGPGIYRLTWSAVAQDLHVGKGSLEFTVLP